MAIIWSILHRQTGDDEYRAAARNAVAFPKRQQVLGGPTPIDGALSGSSPVFGRYMFLRYPNWGVKFFSDAIMCVKRNAGPGESRERDIDRLRNSQSV